MLYVVWKKPMYSGKKRFCDLTFQIPDQLPFWLIHGVLRDYPWYASLPEFEVQHPISLKPIA